MKLRLRLGLVTLAVALPLMAAFVWVNLYAQERAAIDVIASFTLSQMQAGEREHCESTPERWMGRHRPPRGRPPPGELFDPPPGSLPRPHHGPPGPPPDEPPFPDEPPLPGDQPPWERGPPPPPHEGPDGPRPDELFAPPHGPPRGGPRGGGPPGGPPLRAPERYAYDAALVSRNPEAPPLDDALRAAMQEGRQMAQREQALRSFLENTTHDVMIPLTVLKGHLASLDKQASRGEPVASATVTAAMQEAHYMASLIHNLAVAARLEAGAPELAKAPVALGGLVGRAVSRHLPIARQKQVSLDAAVPEEPVWVQGDVTLIEQAVSNVIYYAIRYNHPGGHVAVILEALEHGARFRLRVLDDGPGIPENERARLIERRFRGNQARTRDPDGHGLGLNIAYHVATLHGFELVLGPSEFGGLQVDFLGPLQR